MAGYAGPPAEAEGGVMILAKINGRKIVSNAVRSGHRVHVEVKLDGRPIGYLYRRHKVFWLSVAYERAPDWARPFLDRAQWGSATVDSLRITVTTVLSRALMLHLGVSCEDCGDRATGFALHPDGRKAMGPGDVDEREAIPQCYGCRHRAPRRRTA